MSSESRKERFQEQAESNIDAAALRMARSVQVPGQTPEQTKLVAQGIAKGIALYRKQQNEKARERDRQRKRALKQRDRIMPEEQQETLSPSEGGKVADLMVLILWIAGGIFAVLALLQVLRLVLRVSVTIGDWSVPLWWSLPTGALTAAFAAACFWGVRRLRASSVH